MSTLLKTEHLKKYYGKKKIVKAVDDVSLEIHAGSSMALIGESGSGKTTFGKQIRESIIFWEKKVAEAEAEEKGRGRNRIYHFSPHDV